MANENGDSVKHVRITLLKWWIQGQALIEDCQNKDDVHAIEIPIDYSDDDRSLTTKLREKTCILSIRLERCEQGAVVNKKSSG